MAKEQSEIAKVEGMLGDAFGSLGGLEQTTQEEVDEPIPEHSSQEVGAVTESTEESDSEDSVVDNQPADDVVSPSPTGPPSGPPDRQVALLWLHQ